MAALFVLLLLGSGLVFMVQNQEPILLYFLGNSDKTALFSFALPVGLWVISFILLGVLLSLLFQALSRVGQPVTPSRPAPRPPKATKSPKTPVSPPPPIAPPPPVSPPTDRWGWENPIPEADDW
ncbi:MAG: LapA family protein, partial [Microcystaceae cyanobacterium]